MKADNQILPTDEPKRSRGTDRTLVLHPKYLVGLLPPGKDPDKPFYRGDIYDKTTPTPVAAEWGKETEKLPYLNRIRDASDEYPDLAHLASWMEVSTAVSRYKYLSQHREDRRERTKRVKVCQIDFQQGSPTETKDYSTPKELSDALLPSRLADNKSDARIYVVEDLSQEVIEQFGSAFNIDPHFFRSHIDDYLWNTLTGDAVELRHLDVFTRKRPFWTVRYLRPRYYRSCTSYEKATREAASFNVLRQLDSDRSLDVIKNKTTGEVAVLMRAKASLWVQPKEESSNKGVVAILLVDPTPSEGFPLWGGYSAFRKWSKDSSDAPSRKSLYDDVIHWMRSLDDSAISLISREPKTCVLPALWLIISDWHHVLQYVTTQLGEIEWEIEIPALRKDDSGIDLTVKKLHPWRRNVTLYRAMVAKAIDDIFSDYSLQIIAQTPIDNDREGLPALKRDFEIILRDIGNIQARIERIVSVAAALLNIEDGRRAQAQNNNVARLTYLATIFIPLSFVSGFLSMNANVDSLKRTFWIYFTIAIPLTAIALVVADFLDLRTKIETWFAGTTKKKGGGKED